MTNVRLPPIGDVREIIRRMPEHTKAALASVDWESVFAPPLPLGLRMRRLWRSLTAVPPVPLPIYPHVQVGVCLTCWEFYTLVQPVFPQKPGGYGGIFETPAERMQWTPPHDL